MKKSRTWLMFVVLCSCWVMGCDPSRFYLESTHPITCRIFAPIATVTHSIHDFTVNEGGAVDMSVAELTQYRMTMNVSLLQGDGYRLMLRPVAEESVVDSGLVLVLSKTHSRLDSSGHTIVDLPNVHLRQSASDLITILSEDHRLEVTLNCDTIVKRMTPIKESDDLVVAPLGNSSVRVIVPDWKEIEPDVK